MITSVQVPESLDRILSGLRASLYNAGSYQFTKTWLGNSGLLRSYENVDDMCTKLLLHGMTHVVPLVSKKTTYEMVDKDGGLVYSPPPRQTTLSEMGDTTFEECFEALQRIAFAYELVEWGEADLVCRDGVFGNPERQTELGARENEIMPPDDSSYDDEYLSDEYREGKKKVRIFCKEALRRNRIVFLEFGLYCLPEFEETARKADVPLAEIDVLFRKERVRVVDSQLRLLYPLFSERDLMLLGMFSDKSQLTTYLEETQCVVFLGERTAVSSQRWYTVTDAYEKLVASTSEEVAVPRAKELSEPERDCLLKGAYLKLREKLLAGFTSDELGFSRKITRRLVDAALRAGIFVRDVETETMVCHEAAFRRLKSKIVSVYRQDDEDETEEQELTPVAQDMSEELPEPTEVLVVAIDESVPETVLHTETVLEIVPETVPETETVPEPETVLEIVPEMETVPEIVREAETSFAPEPVPESEPLQNPPPSPTPEEPESVDIIKTVPPVLMELVKDFLSEVFGKKSRKKPKAEKSESPEYGEMGKILANPEEWRRCYAMEDVLVIVARYYRIEPGILLGKWRSRPVTGMRQVLFFLMNMSCHESQGEIGSFVGGRAQSAVSGASLSVRARLLKEEELVREIADLRKLIRGE